MDQVGNILNRPKFYHNIDGLVELEGSVMCLGFALLLWLRMLSPADSVWHQISWFAFVGLVLLIHYGTKAVKTRITYPRTGFVEYRRPWHTQAIAAALGALVTASLYIVFRRHWDISMLASLTGLVFAAAYGYGIARAVRWKWVIVGTMAVASFVIAFLPADILGALASDSSVGHPGGAKLDESILLSLMAYGTMLLISGGISFWLYLRHTQAPAQDAQ
jgi:multisubunit Na+/H+ antiporter MnhB subunit